MTMDPSSSPTALRTLPSSADGAAARRARLAEVVDTHLRRGARARLAEWGEVPHTPPLRGPLLALTAVAGLGATATGATGASLFYIEPVPWLPPLAVGLIGLVATGAALQRQPTPFLHLTRLLVVVGLGLGLLAALKSDGVVNALFVALSTGALWWLTAATARAAAWASELLDRHERSHSERLAHVTVLKTLLENHDGASQ